MKTIKARFDGRVFVPVEPVDLPSGSEAEVRVPHAKGDGSCCSPTSETDAPQPCDEVSRQSSNDESTDHRTAQEAERPLAELLERLDQLPDNPEWPADGAAQHDHYLYGMPKRP